MGLARALGQHHEKKSANAIKLLMLTGARRSEVLGSRWDMFDLENGVWTKPSSHTKQRRIHRVPLNGPALQLLCGMRAGIKKRIRVRGSRGKPLTDINGPG